MALERFKGEQFTFTTNKHKSCTIREQNGDDDDVLTKVGKANAGRSVSDFVRAIILDYDGQGPLTEEAALSMPSSERNYILMKSRRHSLGDIVPFEYTCPVQSCNTVTPMEEDLSELDEDFSKPTKSQELSEDNENPKEKPTVKEREPNKHRVKPIPGDKLEIEHKLSSGKEIKFELLNTYGETISLDIPADEMSKNKELTLRNLHLKDGNGQWHRITVFNVFSSREMSEIRAKVRYEDPQFDIVSETKCPKCSQKTEHSLIHSPNFFFPVEI